MASLWRMILFLFVVVLLTSYQLGESETVTLEPGEKAPPFTLQSLLGGVVRYGQNTTSHSVYPPLVFLAYTQESAFLEALLHNADSLEDLIKNSPENTHYIFMSWEKNSFALAEKFHHRLDKVLRDYHLKRKWVFNLLHFRFINYWYFVLLALLDEASNRLRKWIDTEYLPIFFKSLFIADWPIEFDLLFAKLRLEGNF